MRILNEPYNTVLKTGTHTQRASGFFPWQYRPERDAEQSPPPRVEIKSELICTSLSHCLHGIQRDDFTFKVFNIFYPLYLYIITNMLGTQDYSCYLDALSDRFQEHSLETHHQL